MNYQIDNHKFRRLKPNYHIIVSLTIKRFIGTWPPIAKPKRYFYSIYTIISFIFTLGIYLIVQAINLSVIWGDIDRMVASAVLFMTNAVHTYKIIVILRNEIRLRMLLNILKSPSFSRDNKKYERIFSYYSWQGIIHHVIFQSISCVTVACWGLIPIADAVLGISRRLPMDAWYPFDVKQSPAFELTCAHQFIAVVICCIHNISMDTLITGLLNVACCQIEVIKHNLLNIDLIEATEECENRIEEEYVAQELHRCIEHSNVVMRFVMEIRSIFGGVILSQLTINCGIICLTAFHITKMTTFNPTEAFGMMMYMCSMTYQLFIYCYHGNELALQSRSVGVAVFASNWWKFNRRFKQSVGIFITRWHKPVIFTAGPFIQVSLDTFVGFGLFHSVDNMRIQRFLLIDVLWLFLILHQVEYSRGEEDSPSEIGQSTTYRTWMERTLQKVQGLGDYIPPFLKPGTNKNPDKDSNDGGYGSVLNIFKDRIHAIVPGTRWCGDGNIAKNDEDVGFFRRTDACCRQHDKCTFNIVSGKSFENLKNDGLFTRSACECDQAFYHCLKAARNPIAYDIGYTYFNVLRPQCIIYYYPIVACKERDGLINTKCIAYECDESKPEQYQWIDNPNF